MWLLGLSPSNKKAGTGIWTPGVALAELKAVTEGVKDGLIGTIEGGQPVGAIAGVTHVEKVLPKGSGINLVFDSDGYGNANVTQALIKGGLHLGGKIALIPLAAGDKAGFTEFFNAGFGKEDFDNLLAGGVTPRKFLLNWLDYLLTAPLPKHCDTAPQLYKRLWRLAWWIDRDCVDLTARIEAFCLAHSQANGAKLSKPAVRSLRKLALAPLLKVESAEEIEARKKEAKLPRGGGGRFFGGSAYPGLPESDCAGPNRLPAVSRADWPWGNGQGHVYPPGASPGGHNQYRQYLPIQDCQLQV